MCLDITGLMVNVIPYNPGGAPISHAPSDAETDAFIHALRAQGLPVRKRITKGRSVMAACGQLGNVELRQLRKKPRPSTGDDPDITPQPAP